MANLEHILYEPSKPIVARDTVVWEADSSRGPIDGLPQIFWSDGAPWREANVWALERAESGLDLTTVQSNLKHVAAYADWLEDTDTTWWHFPDRKADRCLFRFRGALTKARDAGELAPSTVSARMAAVLKFYRWVQHNGLLGSDLEFWQDTVVPLKFANKFGFERTMNVISSELKIVHRKTAGGWDLESGLMPVTIAQRNTILAFAREHSSPEVHLMLRLGFGTGMRLGTICDLKERTVLHATVSGVPGFHELHVGPGATPSVKTKSSRGAAPTGRVLIPDDLLEYLTNYMWSDRRISRKHKANKADKPLVFLTQYGNCYRSPDGNHPGVTMELVRLRKLAASQGIDVLKDFHFHQSRATFATHLTACALEAFSNTASAIRFVRDACLHKDEVTTMQYVTFLEESAELEAAGAEFTQFFMGLE